jgi:hypothetical protein
MQLQETINTNDFEISSSVWAIGQPDQYKVMSIWTIISELAKEPSEVIVICPDMDLGEIYDSFDSTGGIPIAYNLLQIAKILNQLVDEMHDRQKRLRCYGKLSHRIICAIELDSLHTSLKERAAELGVNYDARELNGAIEMLQEEGVKVGIYLVGSADSISGLSTSCAQLYSGTEVLKFTLTNSEIGGDIHSQMIAQKIPVVYL